jgi:predicted nucleotidyltransferase component of viral defense system
VRPLREIEGLRLAALEDIAAMKLAAVAQRGSKKDFVDVFGFGRHFGLGDMLAFYREKFGVEDVGRTF